MTFTVSHSKKEFIESMAIHYNRKLRLLNTVADYVPKLCSTAALIIIWFAVFDDEPGINLPALISAYLVMTISSLLIRHCIQWIVVSIASEDISNRTNEVLTLSNGTFRYSYPLADSSSLSERILISIPADSIYCLFYDEETYRITLKGRMSGTVVQSYNSILHTTPTGGNLTDFVIYDYFKPSLYQALRKETGTETYRVSLIHGASPQHPAPLSNVTGNAVKAAIPEKECE